MFAFNNNKLPIYRPFEQHVVIIVNFAGLRFSYYRIDKKYLILLLNNMIILCSSIYYIINQVQKFLLFIIVHIFLKNFGGI